MTDTSDSLPVRMLLAEACQRVGREVPRWTQGAGGNISFKHGENLWIKASGHRLDAVTADAAIALLPLHLLRQHFERADVDASDAENAYAALLVALSHPDYGRASMESGFHGLLPKTFVAHFHALSAVAMAHAMQNTPKRWAAFVQESGYLAPAWLPPVAPGLHLSTAVSALPPFEICVLSHHGVILHADDASVIDRWQAFENAFCHAWNLTHLAVNAANLALSQTAQGPLRVIFPDTAVFMARLKAITQDVDAAAEVYAPTGWGKTRQLVPKAQACDRDATELWHATQLVHQACPKLSDLPEDISAAVCHMPTEQWRQRLNDVPNAPKRTPS